MDSLQQKLVWIVLYRAWHIIGGAAAGLLDLGLPWQM